MADQALSARNQESEGETAPVLVDKPKLQLTAAKMYGAGMERPMIARALVDYLVPHRRHRPMEQRLSQARNKLRGWEQTQDFRDLVYQYAVVKLDMATPGIFTALTKRAKKGRVDAARLVLELTGRHNPKGDQTPPQIIVAINGMPRPVGTPDFKQIDSEVVDQVEADDEV